MDKVIGSEVKLRFSVTNIDNCTLRDTDFKIMFYTNDKENKNVVFQKSQLVNIDANTYVCIVDSNLTGTGQIKMELTMWVPDSDCADGQRTEIIRGVTDVNIVL